MVSAATAVPAVLPTNAAPLERLFAYAQALGSARQLRRTKRGVPALVLALLFCGPGVAAARSVSFFSTSVLFVFANCVDFVPFAKTCDKNQKVRHTVPFAFANCVDFVPFARACDKQKSRNYAILRIELWYPRGKEASEATRTARDRRSARRGGDRARGGLPNKRDPSADSSLTARAAGVGAPRRGLGLGARSHDSRWPDR
jgi:hypothetical protein